MIRRHLGKLKDRAKMTENIPNFMKFFVESFIIEFEPTRLSGSKGQIEL